MTTTCLTCDAKYISNESSAIDSRSFCSSLCESIEDDFVFTDLDAALLADEQLTDWYLMKDHAGFNVDVPVTGAYVNAVALYAWQSADDWFNCAVTGQLTTGGKTLEEARQRGIEYATRYGREEADRRVTRKQFEAKIQLTGS